MAWTAAFGSGPELAEVSFAHKGPSQTKAYRLGEAFFIPRALLEEWGWKVTPQGRAFQILADGREFEIDTRPVFGKPTISLAQLVAKIDAETSWDEDQDVVSVLSRMNAVVIDAAGISIGGTLPMQAKAFRLAGPDRLVIDFEGAKLDPKLAANLPSDVRLGQYSPRTVRLVIQGPRAAGLKPTWAPSPEFRLEWADPNVVPPPLPMPGALAQVGPPDAQVISELATLVRWPVSGPVATAPSAIYISPTLVQLTLTDASPAPDFAAESSWTGPLVRSVRASDDGKGAMTFAIQLSQPAVFQTRIRDGGLEARFERPQKADGKLAGKVVIVDAGHGGKDGGARWVNSNEKNITLAIAKQLSQELASLGMSVIMTRGDDRYVSLGERSAISNRSKADLFVSVHVNSNTTAGSRSGSITFHHKQVPIGMLLATCVQNEVARVPGIPGRGIWSDQRIYKSGFAVLRNTSAPAVLVETGFINHPSDRMQLENPLTQKYIAQAIARGIKVFFGNGS